MSGMNLERIMLCEGQKRGCVLCDSTYLAFWQRQQLQGWRASHPNQQHQQGGGGGEAPAAKGVLFLKIGFNFINMYWGDISYKIM